jgi:glycine/D-amino acid oxidase-like deaminating enzyme
MAADTIFHPDFKPEPYWWEAYRPTSGELVEVPRTTRVAIVGGGYGGLATALELHKQRIDSVVLEASALGHGASTRSGGAVSGGVNIGKSFTGKSIDQNSERAKGLLEDAADAFSAIERIIAEENIDCCWQKNGRFTGAWTPKHYAKQAERVAQLNDAAQSG